MKLRHRLLYSELLRCRNDDEAQAVLRMARDADRSTSRMYAVYVGSQLLIVGIIAAAISPLWNLPTWMPIVTLATCGLLLLILMSNSVKSMRRSIRVSLSHMGHPCCVACGYDLTGNVSGVCPECGTDVVEGE